jgi:hypothetical protein
LLQQDKQDYPKCYLTDFLTLYQFIHYISTLQR